MTRKTGNTSTGSDSELMSSDWPEGGLEPVTKCPLCTSNQRISLHIGLKDSVFFCAPGEWNLYQCMDCRCAYLDPRPTPETIGLAYQHYYTHSPLQKTETGSLGTLSRIRRALANGYRNWRFGTDYRPANSIGVVVALIFPTRRRILDQGFRNLPRPEPGSRLLDVGFGSGAFLESARDAGWYAAGADPDPVAVAAALNHGLDVRQGGIEAFSDMQENFDVITMDHVIEHVHDPLATLQTGYRLLKPGGFLWLSTPNIQSLGHARYGRNWRGLEPPRHLLLFNWSTMSRLLQDFGFQPISREEDNRAFEIMAAKSDALAKGLDQHTNARVRFPHRLRGYRARMITFFQPNRTEFITLRAYKPLRNA